MPGHRDVDASGVDLDAWFADRDVQAYVDRLDRQSARNVEASTPAAAFPSDWLVSADPSPLDPDAQSQGETPDGIEDPSTREPRPWRPWAFGAVGLVLLAALAFAVQRNSTQPPEPEESASLEQTSPEPPSPEPSAPPQEPYLPRSPLDRTALRVTADICQAGDRELEQLRIGIRESKAVLESEGKSKTQQNKELEWFICLFFVCCCLSFN